MQEAPNSNANSNANSNVIAVFFVVINILPAKVIHAADMLLLRLTGTTGLVIRSPMV